MHPPAILFPWLLLPRGHAAHGGGPGAAVWKVPCGCPGQLTSWSWMLHMLWKQGSAVEMAFQPGSTTLWCCGPDLACIYHFAGSKKLHVIIISHSLSAPLSLLLGTAFSSVCFPCADCCSCLYIYFCQNFATLGKQSWLVIIEHGLPRPSSPRLS